MKQCGVAIVSINSSIIIPLVRDPPERVTALRRGDDSSGDEAKLTNLLHLSLSMVEVKTEKLRNSNPNLLCSHLDNFDSPNPPPNPKP